LTKKDVSDRILNNIDNVIYLANREEVKSTLECQDERERMCEAITYVKEPKMYIPTEEGYVPFEFIELIISNKKHSVGIREKSGDVWGHYGIKQKYNGQ
jgi:hypothetical protein